MRACPRSTRSARRSCAGERLQERFPADLSGEGLDYRRATSAVLKGLDHAKSGLTERRRSRTDPAWGCHALLVLKTSWATGPGRSARSVAPTGAFEPQAEDPRHQVGAQSDDPRSFPAPARAGAARCRRGCRRGARSTASPNQTSPAFACGRNVTESARRRLTSVRPSGVRSPRVAGGLPPHPGWGYGRPAPDPRSVGARAAHLVSGRAGAGRAPRGASRRGPPCRPAQPRPGRAAARDARSRIVGRGREAGRLHLLLGLVELAPELLGRIAGGRDVDDRLRPPRAAGEATARTGRRARSARAGAVSFEADATVSRLLATPSGGCPGAVAPEGGAASDQGKESHG